MRGGRTDSKVSVERVKQTVVEREAARMRALVRAVSITGLEDFFATYDGPYVECLLRVTQNGAHAQMWCDEGFLWDVIASRFQELGLQCPMLEPYGGFKGFAALEEFPFFDAAPVFISEVWWSEGVNPLSATRSPAGSTVEFLFLVPASMMVGLDENGWTVEATSKRCRVRTHPLPRRCPEVQLIPLESRLEQLEVGRACKINDVTVDQENRPVFALGSTAGEDGGPHRYGVALINDDGSSTVWSKGRGKLPSQEVICVRCAPDGTLWAGTTSGIALLAADGRCSKVYTTEDGLLDDAVRMIAHAPDGSAWCVSRGGLTRLGADGSVVTVNEKSGLHDQIVCMGVDRQGHAWVGSGDAVFRVYPDGTCFLVARTPSKRERGTRVANPVTALVTSEDRRHWVSVDGELYRLDGHVLKPVMSPGGRLHPDRMTSDGNSGVWLQCRGGLVVHQDREGNWSWWRAVEEGGGVVTVARLWPDGMSVTPSGDLWLDAQLIRVGDVRGARRAAI